MLELKIIDNEENLKKQEELCDKIIPLFDGYTFQQIHKALIWAEERIKDEYIINLSD